LKSDTSNPRIAGVLDMSTVDWYGNVSLVVFWAGCNLRCPYCHNSPLIPLDSGTLVPPNYLENRIQQAMHPVPSLDAVVFTGGEPLLQPQALITAAKTVKKHKLGLMLDTNGTLWEAAKQVLETGLFDRVALDVKAPLTPEDYAKVTGVNQPQYVESVRRVLNLCAQKGIEVEARTTVAPGLTDREKQVRSIAREIAGLADEYYLQQFSNQGDILDPVLKAREPPTRETMVELAHAALEEGVEKVFIKTSTGGLERIR